MSEIKVGQKWKDNYPYPPGHERIVTVFAVDLEKERVQIGTTPMQKRWAQARRFNGRSGGYSLVEDSHE